MATTVYDLDYNGYTSVLLRYANGEQALWIRDEYMAGHTDQPHTYTINDVNESIPFGDDEDIDAAIDGWKRAVEWDDETD